MRETITTLAAISGRVPIAAVVFVAAWLGCGGAQNRGGDSEEAVVGEPPSEQDDPFRIMNTPEEAERASSSGYIGSKEAPEDSDAEPSDASAVEASEAEPPAEEREERPPSRPDAVRCFSCVRICPIGEASRSESSAECGAESNRDVICGWGVHEERETAEELARAECDGALDMAREMKTWSRIDGACPSAKCQGR